MKNDTWSRMIPYSVSLLCMFHDSKCECGTGQCVSVYCYKRVHSVCWNECRFMFLHGDKIKLCLCNYNLKDMFMVHYCRYRNSTQANAKLEFCMV